MTDSTTDINDAWYDMVKAVSIWTNHMDQWEKLKFETEYGPIYVTIRRMDDYPDSFDLVDRKTGKVIQQAGIGPETTKHEYPSNYGPGTHWATDAAWEILDRIKPGVISVDVRSFLAGMISGRLMSIPPS